MLAYRFPDQLQSPLRSTGTFRFRSNLTVSTCAQYAAQCRSVCLIYCAYLDNPSAAGIHDAGSTIALHAALISRELMWRRVVSAVLRSRHVRAASPMPTVWPMVDRRAGSALRRV